MELAEPSRSQELEYLRGTGRHKPRGGAPRGERPTSLDARRDASRLRAYVTGPPKGAAAPERLSALRPLTLRDGDIGKPRRSHCLARTMMRAGNADYTLLRFVRFTGAVTRPYVRNVPFERRVAAAKKVVN
jgi:hypothetical protein